MGYYYGLLKTCMGHISRPGKISLMPTINVALKVTTNQIVTSHGNLYQCSKV